MKQLLSKDLTVVIYPRPSSFHLLKKFLSYQVIAFALVFTPLMNSCTSSYQFTAMDEQHQYAAKAEDCKIEYVVKLPDPNEFIKIGDCVANGKDHYRITNANVNKKAFSKLHECACLNGGDVVYIGDYKEVNRSNEVGDVLNKTYSPIANYKVDIIGSVYKRK